jgi:hypothetical protein
MCPNKNGTGTDPACQQIDGEHAASFGTSFSAPIVAGAVALLLQGDRTLTQDAVVAALQGGAHPLRGASMFQDQAGAGEVDVAGALAAAARLRSPEMSLPVRANSWVTLGADTYLADGSTPLQAVVELRAARAGAGAAPPADGFSADRIAAYAWVDGAPYSGAAPSLVRRGPGVWLATVQMPPGLGGSTLTVGATFDGQDIVEPKSIPIATDGWNAEYPSSIHGGGCAVAAGVDDAGAGGAMPGTASCAVVAAAAAVAAARRRRRSRSGRALRATGRGHRIGST